MTFYNRALSPAPTTVDREARTVEAIVSTGADVPRGGVIERLDLAGADLSRLIGAPVLDAHRTGSTRDQLGVVEAAVLRPEGVWVRIKFRRNEAATAVMGDIADGTLRGLSIGYRVEKWKEVREGSRRIRIAMEWAPVEVSIVPVPADPGAYFRAGERQMEETTEQLPETRQEETAATRAAVNAEIRAIAETAGLTRAWVDARIDADATPEDARRDAFEAMRTRDAQTATRTTRATVGTDHTDPAAIATRAGEALFARMRPEHALSEPARQWAHMSLPDLARDCLTRAGVRTAGLATDAVVTRALHTTSDFALILGDGAGRELRRAYEAAPSGVKQAARGTTVRDFRLKHALQFGDGPDLLKVGESGEFKSGTIAESRESYGAETFGRLFGVTRQAVINDDLGAFARIPAQLGAAAASFEAAQLVAKLTANPAMSDGVAVFHADHGNLTGTYAAPSATSLGAARLAMRKQTGPGGGLIDATPRYVLVPPDLETLGEQVLAAIAATKTADANPFSNLTLIVEPRLTNPEQWYVIADPARIDGLEYAYLEGAPGPQIETRPGFEVDGVQFKVRLDFGCGWVDHSGWHRVG